MDKEKRSSSCIRMIKAFPKILTDIYHISLIEEVIIDCDSNHKDVIASANCKGDWEEIF